MSRTLAELDKYVQTIIPNDLSRLENHTEKLTDYSSGGEKELFLKEEGEAKCTLRHLKSNLKILSSIAAGLTVRDSREADKEIGPMKIRIEQVVHKFQEVCPGPTLLHVESLTPHASEADLLIEPESIGDTKWERVTMSPLETPESLTCEQLVAIESAEGLQNDLLEIQLLFNELCELATNQNRPILRIDEHTQHTEQNISTGRNNLYYASKLKAAAFPVTGALIGGLIGGPIGAVAGFKGAALLGVGGLSVGAAAGWGIKKFHSWSSDRLHDKND